MNATRPAHRRWKSRFLVPLAAFVLLAPLLSISAGKIPGWVLAAFALVELGSGMWGVFRREHDEYLRERERLP
jgi:4-amino-4-deoxy-L-arabinose transferase-like glycosyltransferase